MGQTMTILIPLLFLFTWANHQQVIALIDKRVCIFTDKFEIHVTNKLPQNSAKLKIHCQSKNNDLGFHTLASEQDFHWSFCENLLPNTLFFCHFWWGSKKQTSLQVFNSEWKENCYTGYCYWQARADGIYMSKVSTDLNSFKKFKDWQNWRILNL